MTDMGYLITKSGKLRNANDDTSIEDAITKRIEQLEPFVANGCELKIAFDIERGKWLALSCSEVDGDLFIEDETGEPIIAFDGIDETILTTTLRKSNVYFTQ